MPRTAERRRIADALMSKMLMDFVLTEIDDVDEQDGLRNGDNMDEAFDDAIEDVTLETAALLQYIEQQRYLRSRHNRIVKPHHNTLAFTLQIYKQHYPDMFRTILRVSPLVFDTLVDELSPASIFHNNSYQEQLPVEEQIAIALYRLGHFGNAVGLTEVALWAGKGHGTINLVTRRVLIAIWNSDFQRKALHPPTEHEKEESRQWVEETAGCEGWRGGWCGVDGTLVPLFEKPSHYGTSWFDRKSNYSTNVQVVSVLKTMRIFDFACGLPGSTHDSTGLKETLIYKDPAKFLAPDEWLWADSGYPSKSWIVTPYKAPLRHQEENSYFNRHLSAIRIRSEHAIGYLKGRFQSLRGLRISIRQQQDIHYMNAWIMAAICIHNFALGLEGSIDFLQDEFFREGRQLTTQEEMGVWESEEGGAAGKQKREELKQALFVSRGR